MNQISHTTKIPKDPDNALFSRSAAVTALLELLLICEEGEVVTYEDMTRVTNRDIQRSERHLLDSARRIALKDRAAFSPVVRVGLCRLRPADLVAEGARQIGKISRSAKRSGRVMDTADKARLNQSEQLSHDATRGILASIETAVKSVPQATRQTSSRDPMVRL